MMQGLSRRNIVAVGAHPDDIEYGCLGALLQAKAAGAYTSAVVLTNGHLGGPGRKQESMKALEAAGIESTTWLNLPDGSIPVAHDTVALVEKHLQSADAILTMSEHDTHQDHRACWWLTMAAVRRRPITVVSYRSISSTAQFRSNMFIDITHEYAAKLRALRCHESQAAKDYMDEAWIERWHQNPQAMAAGLLCTEAYMVHEIFTSGL